MSLDTKALVCTRWYRLRQCVCYEAQSVRALCAFRATRYPVQSGIPFLTLLEGQRESRLQLVRPLTGLLSHVHPRPRQRCWHHASVVLITSSGHPARHRPAFDFNKPILRLFSILTIPKAIQCGKTSHNNTREGS